MGESRRKTLQRVVALALPAIFENLIATLAGIVDVAMVGSLGAASTAAAALNAQPMWFANALATLPAGGATVLVARSWGADDRDGAARYARSAAMLALLIGFVLLALAQGVADGYAAWMHAAPDVAPDAAAYMRIVGVSLPFFVLSRTLAGVLQGSGDTVTPMKIGLMSNLFNVIGNYLLIYPPHLLRVFGLEVPVWGAGMGVRGAAMATALSFAFSGGALALSLLRRGERAFFRGSFNFELPRLRGLIQLGLPAAGERIALSSGQIMFMSVVSTLGTISISAHHLAITAEGVCYNPSFGIATAATALVGQALGAGDEMLAERYGRFCSTFCAAVMAAVSACMYFGAEWMIAFFTNDPEVIAQGARCLRIVAWVEAPFGVALTVSAALRAAGDTLVPLWAGIATMWAVRQTAARILVLRMGLGLSGAWYAMDLDVALRWLFLWGYFLTGRWKRVSRRLAKKTRESVIQ